VIQVEQLSIQAGAFRLDGLNLAIPAGTYGVLMGRTGCGKTTLLETVCGLKPARAGRILLCGRDVTALPPAARGIGFVPQDGALFSTHTVRSQLGFALRIRGASEEKIRRKVDELSELLTLRHLLDRKPQGLSGGEGQRVALGRALAFEPKVLCLDEPLSALDEETRDQMYQLLRRVQQETGVTALHITHSRAEAEALGDRVLLLRDGKLQELEPAKA